MSRAAYIAQGLATVASAGVIVMVLGGLGPWIDAQPDRRDEAGQAAAIDRAEIERQQLQRLAERWDREAREECARIGGDNTGYIRKAWGGIQCTDKRGRAIAHRSAP